MAKSSRLRLPEIRRVFRLLGDCRDLGHDRAAWTRRAVAGLCDEFDAYLVIGTFIESSLAQTIQADRSIFEVGWQSARERESWLDLLRTGRVHDYPTVRGIYRQPASSVTVRSRDQLVPDREWSRCSERNEDRRSLHQDETLLGFHRSDSLGTHQVFSINRAVGGRKFDGRERAFLRLFLREFHDLAGSVLTIDDAGPFASLSPRSRQILDALVEGDAEKQIAARLGLSRHTVHDHVKVLYRWSGASSRGEFLAYCHRQRCGR
jgi:DNA-binding CsgD family transcriptional regulator